MVYKCRYVGGNLNNTYSLLVNNQRAMGISYITVSNHEIVYQNTTSVGIASTLNLFHIY